MTRPMIAAFHRLLPAAAVLAALTGAAQAATPSLGGAWTVQVTLVDCQTGSTLAPPFTSLLGFSGNGLESETTNNPALAPGQRSTGFGVWSHAGGNLYHVDAQALILFASTSGPHPIQAGAQRIQQTVTLSGNSFTSTAAITFYDTTGAQVSAGCAKAAGMRLT